MYHGEEFIEKANSCYSRVVIECLRFEYLEIYFNKIHEIAGNNYLQFTCEAWNPGRRPYQNLKEGLMVTG